MRWRTAESCITDVFFVQSLQNIKNSAKSYTVDRNRGRNEGS